MIHLARSTLLNWLLALGFAVGQSSAIVHASHHELVPHPPTSHCTICAFAHAAPIATLPPVVADTGAEWSLQCASRTATPAHANFAILPPSRAPPAFHA